MPTCHVPVLLNELVEMVRAKEGGRFLDCTLGGGGHTRAVLDAHAENRVVALDRDARAIARAGEWRERYGDRLDIRHLRFSEAVQAAGGDRFDGVFADLGVSTDQLHEGRGFSFSDASSLDMRMDESAGSDALDLVNNGESRELYRILKRGGVGAEAQAAVDAITRSRPFHAAKDLAAVLAAVPVFRRRDKAAHPATVVFQALRIAVNREFEEIEALLEAAPELVRRDCGRLAVITFHSLEDKLATRCMRGWESGDSSYPASWPGAPRGVRLGRVITRKPVLPDEREVALNPSSRSARLRVFEFELP